MHPYLGFVFSSSISRIDIASSFVSPHISPEGFRPMHTFGLSGLPNSLHRLFSVSCMHRIPAGFPSGIPGMYEDMDGAVQHAPQPTLQSMPSTPAFRTVRRDPARYRHTSGIRSNRSWEWPLALYKTLSRGCSSQGTTIPASRNPFQLQDVPEMRA